MTKIILTIFSILYFQGLYTQTFHSGFDKQEHFSGVGFQGSSYQSNIGSSSHNTKSVFSVQENDSTPKTSFSNWSVSSSGGLNFLTPYYSNTYARNLITLQTGVRMLISYRPFKFGYFSTGLEWNSLKTICIEKEQNIFGDFWERTRKFNILSIPFLFSLSPRENWKIAPELNFGVSFGRLMKNERISCSDIYGCSSSVDFVNGDWTLAYHVGMAACYRIRQGIKLTTGVEINRQHESFRSSYVSGSSFRLTFVRFLVGLDISL